MRRLRAPPYRKALLVELQHQIDFQNSNLTAHSSQHAVRYWFDHGQLDGSLQRLRA
jgi:hypothetical protein